MKLSATLERINFFIALITVALLPVFFLPTTAEFYDFNKQALLFVAASVSLLMWAIKFVVDRQVRVTRSPLGLPILLFGIVWAASTMFRSPNRIEALFEPSQTGTMLSLVALFFTSITAIHTKKQVEGLVKALLISFISLSAVTVAWSSGLMPMLLPEKFFMSSNLWTPTGNPFNSLVLLVTALPFSALLVLKGRGQNQDSKAILPLTTFVIAAIAVGLLTFRLFISQSAARPVFLPQATSWAIAMEALKVSPLLGTGPSTYLADFTRFRPADYNNTLLWSVRFASSSNYYLQVLTTLGFLGLGAYVFIVLRASQMLTKSLKTSSESALHSVVVASTASAALVLLSQFFLPTSLLSLAVFFFLCIISVTAFKLLGSSLVHDANIDIVAAADSGAKSPLLPIISLVLVILTLIPAWYLFVRSYTAEVFFQTALSAVAKNDGKLAYEQLIKAYQANPYRDSYRVAYSQTNLLLANALAAKKDLSDADKQTVSQLISQSIREAKNAVALNQSKVTNVENLANTYRSLISIAKGADAWTVAAYKAAIQLDPTNPNLRISLGGVMYSLKQYDAAITLFQQAIDLKSDLANAYYNLAAAYREKGDFQKAASAMQAVTKLVKADSADYTKATAELQDLTKKAGQKVAGSATESKVEPAQTTLETAKPIPSPKTTPIELPADLAPEGATPSVVTPTSAVTPAPTR